MLSFRLRLSHLRLNFRLNVMPPAGYNQQSAAATACRTWSYRGSKRERHVCGEGLRPPARVCPAYVGGAQRAGA
jgi:hypothetical protein